MRIRDRRRDRYLLLVANVTPGYKITRLRVNTSKERSLSTHISPEAGKFYDITLNFSTYCLYTPEELKILPEGFLFHQI